MPVLNLPEEIEMRAVMFGSLAKGGHLQTFENEEFGVCVSNVKQDRNAKWTAAWTIKGVDEVFDSYKLLREAVNGKADDTGSGS